MYIYIYIYIYTYIYIFQDFVLGVTYLYIYKCTKSNTFFLGEKASESRYMCRYRDRNLFFPTSLCGVLVFGSLLPRYLLSPSSCCLFLTYLTQVPHTPLTYPYITYSHTHNLSTHNFPIHDLLTHNLPTCPHTTCPYTTYSHTICLHKLSTDELLIDDIFTLTHTQLTHTYTRLTHTQFIQHYLFTRTHTHNFFTRNLLITWCGRRGIWRHRSIYILCGEVLWG